MQVPWQELLGPASTADEHGQAKAAAGHGASTARPVLQSLAWLQLPGAPGPEGDPGEGGGPAQTLLLAADRWGNLAALDTEGRSQPLRLLPAGHDPHPSPCTGLTCLPRAAWAAAASGADASEGRLGAGERMGQLALCVLGRAAGRAAARGTHGGLVLTGGSTVAVFTVAPSGAAAGPPALTVAPVSFIAMGRAGAGMPCGSGYALPAGVPAKSAAYGAATGNGQHPPAMAFSSKVCRMLISREQLSIDVLLLIFGLRGAWEMCSAADMCACS